MGIFDDAIREHLELKRRAGASGDDLDRLEKEAFGPPTRPGDPDFEQPGEPDMLAEAGAVGTAEATAAAPAKLQPEAEPDAPPEPSAGEPAEAESAEPEADAAAEPGADPELSSAERARIDHSDLQDTAAHEALQEDAEPAGDSEAAADLGSSGPPPDPIEAEIFDQDDETELGDLGLEEVVVEEEAEAEGELPAAEPESEEVAAVPPAAAAEDDGDAEEEEDEGEEDFDLDLDLDDEEGEEEDEEEEEGLLEETPDFLQDAPEGERLWFEQGEPEDFDFDD
jgi:hypothetical protein